MIDLHIHSTFSDGTCSPETIVIEAKKRGLKAIAVTDHDTIAGVELAQIAGKKHDLEVISGIELSAAYNEREIHILGYGMDYTSPSFLEALEDFATKRIKRNQLILEALTKQGVYLDFCDVNKQFNQAAILTRAHFANALLEKGYVKYRQEAFDRYLGDGKPACMPKQLLPAEACIKLIHEAGGYAILAHPSLYKLNKVRMYDLIYTLKGKGLDGIESIYPAYTPTQQKEFLKLCSKLDLLPTGGSDFHGENKPSIQLGIGSGSLYVPHTFLTPLLQGK